MQDIDCDSKMCSPFGLVMLFMFQRPKKLGNKETGEIGPREVTYIPTDIILVEIRCPLVIYLQA